MFDPKLYCNDCDRLCLDEEKIKEMVTMTENQKKPVHRPARVALVVAALAAALGITASAAEIPAIKEFFTTMFITIAIKDDPALGLSLPTVSVEEREGRRILVVNEDEVDVTDALVQKGEYLYEGDGFQVAVDEDGAAVVTTYGDDGMTVTYSVGEAESQSGAIYKVATEGDISYDDYTVSVDTEGTDTSVGTEADRMGVYNIVTDESGAIAISPVTEK